MKLSDRVIEQERIGLKYTELIAEIQALEAERDNGIEKLHYWKKNYDLLADHLLENRHEGYIWRKACELLIVALSQKNIYNIPSKEQYKLEYWYEKAKLKLESKNAD